MNPRHLLLYVIQETLTYLARYEPRMDNEVSQALLLGTAMVESNLQHLQQIGGPAVSIWQVEPNTHLDCWRSWLSYRPEMFRAYRRLCVFEPSPEEMRWNLMYACAMARLVYWRAKEKLPELDAYELAGYYLRHYNTAAGKSTEEKSVPHFRQAIRYVRPISLNGDKE